MPLDDDITPEELADENLSDSDWAQLAREDPEWIGTTRLSLGTQLELIATGNEDVMRNLANSEYLHVEAQEAIAASDDWVGLYALAFREDLTLKSQLLLVKSRNADDHERWRQMAFREDLAEEAMVALAGCDDLITPKYLAENKQIPRKAVIALAARGDNWVNDTLIKNDSFYWDTDLPVKIWMRKPRTLRDEAIFEGYDAEAVMALAPNWEGDLASLYEASVLVARSN